MSNVTAQHFTNGPVDEVKFAAFVAKTIRSNRWARDRAKKGGIWFGLTDEECDAAARSYCACYRHQFRVLIPVSFPVA